MRFFAVIRTYNPKNYPRVNTQSVCATTSIVMIRKNLLLGKIKNIKTSSKILFDRYMKKFIPEKETCPICKAKGKCHVHAYYNRTITDFISGKKVTFSLCVTRVICDSCDHTHAILPDHLVPYGTYSIFFITSVLSEHFCHFQPIEKICERFDISVNLFRKWRDTFIRHKRLKLGSLQDETTSAKSFLNDMCQNPYSDFSSEFIRCFSFSYMQVHKNPVIYFKNTAGYCQDEFAPDYDIS